MTDDVGRSITDDDLNTLLSGPVAGKLKPHPATGWMSVIKIPGSLIMPPAEEPEEMPVLHVETPQGTFHMEPVMGGNQRVGIIGAKVVEVGKFPGNPDEDSKSPFEWGPGDTIYMASDRGIEIGDYTLVMIDKVICFTKADENED